ncbi:hypothetical protein TSAR_014785 [Trichomalopsis sarcophagae]|uniref:Uncharacterized protein n=1 Tax=Trichomalopsis sarcophagae TaxID=543379 RepID=A0A232EEI7_9HYME|nr:hypothetical protein TSAR_014785 [Trichomalopsis sarcophagae]
MTQKITEPSCRYNLCGEICQIFWVRSDRSFIVYFG